MDKIKNLNGSAFSNCANLTYVSAFPTGVTTFLNTFYGCNKLKSVTVLSNDFESFYEIEDNKHMITVNFPANSNSYSYEKSYFSKTVFNKVSIKTIDNQTDNKNVISCFGDSITEVSSNNKTTYPMQLYSLYNDKKVVLNNGVAGEVSNQIAYRSGAYKIYTKAFTIPSDADTDVQIDIYGNNLNLPKRFPQVRINGVDGVITVKTVDNNTVYYFSRIESGSEVYVEDDTVVQMLSDVSKLTDKDILVIHAGTNNLQENEITDGTKINNVIDDIKAIIGYAGTSKYVVVGITTAKRYNSENSSLYESKMQEEFGDNFINTRLYFLENAYDIIDSTPTDDEIAQMDDGTVPDLFRMDVVHLGANGQKVNAKAIYDKIDALGYNEPEKEPESSSSTTTEQISTTRTTTNPVTSKTTTESQTTKSETPTTALAKTSKPKATSVKKLSKAKKSFKVTYKKISGVTGYQVTYSTSKKYTKKTTKTVTIKGAKNTSKTIKKLKAKKKYYVKVRTYKTVKGKKVYSSWSKTKTVTVK